MRYQRWNVWVVLIASVVFAGCTHFEIGLEQSAAPITATRGSIIATPPRLPTLTPISTATATELPTAQAATTPIGPARLIEPSPSPSPTAEPTMLPVEILNFTVEPAEVNPGDTVTLRWTTINAEQVRVDQYLPDSVPYSETLNLPLTGEFAHIVLMSERQWHVFQLTATNTASTVEQSVKVVIRCPDTYFFGSPLEADRQHWDCPDGPAITSNAAEQAFENGRMFWTEHDQRIYVLLGDGTYRVYEDTWTADEPDRDPTLIPPTDRYQPVRGFGKVWRTQPNVRDQLGWALGLEKGFETQIQGGWIHCCSQLEALNRPIYVRMLDWQVMRLWAGEVPPGQWSVFTP